MKAKAKVVAEIVINRPALGKVILGDLAGRGRIIPCEDLTAYIFHEGVTYEYCGTMDGIGIYKRAGELRELEAERGTQTTRGE